MIPPIVPIIATLVFLVQPSINNNDINTLATSIKNNESLKDAYKNSPSFKELCKDDYFLDIVKLAKKIDKKGRWNLIDFYCIY